MTRHRHRHRTPLRALAALAALGCATAVAPPAHADPGDEDLVPPVITITPPAGGADGWYAVPPEVAVRATDNHVGASGVQLVSWRLSTGTTEQTGTVSRLQGGTVTPPDGTARWTLGVTASDFNGNEAHASVAVGIDRDRPSVAFPGEVRDGRWFGLGSTVLADYTCADVHAGVGTCAGTVAQGSPIDTSTLGYRTFTVTATDRVGNTWTEAIGYTVVENAFTTHAGPLLPTTATVGQDVTVTPPRLSPVPDRIDYQWQRGGLDIPGATGPTYRPTAEDAGTVLRVVATAHKTGFTPKSETSGTAQVVAVLDRLDVSGPAAQRGTARVGQLLTGIAPDITEPVRHPRAAGDPARLAWQWLRDGRPIPGATSFQYRLQPADALRRVAVRITGTAPGYEPVVLTSPSSSTVRRAAAAVRATLASPRRATARLTVTVAVPGVARPGGTVTVRRGTRIVGRARVVGARTVLTLARQARGRVAYTATYAATGVTTRTVRIAGRIR